MEVHDEKHHDCGGKETVDGLRAGTCIKWRLNSNQACDTLGRVCISDYFSRENIGSRFEIGVGDRIIFCHQRGISSVIL